MGPGLCSVREEGEEGDRFDSGSHPLGQVSPPSSSPRLLLPKPSGNSRIHQMQALRWGKSGRRTANCSPKKMTGFN